MTISSLVWFIVPELSTAKEYFVLLVSNSRLLFSSCRNHLIVGAGYAIAEQVNVAFSVTLIIMFAGSSVICAAAKLEDNTISLLNSFQYLDTVLQLVGW